MSSANTCVVKHQKQKPAALSGESKAAPLATMRQQKLQGMNLLVNRPGCSDEIGAPRLGTGDLDR